MYLFLAFKTPSRTLFLVSQCVCVCIFLRFYWLCGGFHAGKRSKNRNFSEINFVMMCVCDVRVNTLQSPVSKWINGTFAFLFLCLEKVNRLNIFTYSIILWHIISYHILPGRHKTVKQFWCRSASVSVCCEGCVWHFIETLKYCKHSFNSQDYNLVVCKITTTILIMRKGMKQIKKNTQPKLVQAQQNFHWNTHRRTHVCAQQENPMCKH